MIQAGFEATLCLQGVMYNSIAGGLVFTGWPWDSHETL